MGYLFDQFKRVLTFAVTDVELAKRNALLADSAYRDDLVARIAALTPECAIYLGLADVASVDGAWTLNPDNQSVDYNPAAAQEESTITFNPIALSVPMRLREAGMKGVLPSSDDDSAPDARVELNLDESTPDPVVASSLQLRVKLVLNGQPAQAGWSLLQLVVLLVQE